MIQFLLFSIFIKKRTTLSTMEFHEWEYQFDINFVHYFLFEMEFHFEQILDFDLIRIVHDKFVVM